MRNWRDALSAEELGDYFEYLDELRASGRTNNMYGARPYLIEEADCPRGVAGDVLTAWMASDLKVPAKSRAIKVLTEAA